MTNLHINERAQQLLKLLIECYIHDGQPVGSKFLATKTSFAMSSATIRNVMADLEQAGFLNSPHTSSGRIPTNLGYRFFVDSLLRTKNLNLGAKDEISTQLPSCNNTHELITATSTMLSNVTKLTGLVMLPRRDLLVLKHIEFIALSNNRILAILVFNKGEVENRIIHTDKIFSTSELKIIGNFLTQNFAGKELFEIRKSLLKILQDECKNIENLTQNIVEIANKALDTDHQNDYVVAGEENLIDITESPKVAKLRDLLAAFTEKRDILHILDQCIHSEGIKIFIGEESGYEPLGDCSVVVKPYYEKGRVIGVLGVIGPTRIHYNNVIAAVDVTSKLLSEALEKME